jgi:hypothetical protein
MVVSNPNRADAATSPATAERLEVDEARGTITVW